MFSLMSCSAEVMKRLTPSMFQEPSSFSVALARPAPTSEPASGSVSTIVQPHCRSTMILRDPLVPLVAVAVDDVREAGSGGVHPDRGVGAEHQLAEGPHEARGGRLAAELLEDLQAPPLGVHPRLVALLERLRDRGRARRGVEDGRVAVAVLVGGGEVLARQPVDLGEDRARGLAVNLREGSVAQDLVPAEHLEEVELDVAQVALVVAHCPTLFCHGPSKRGCYSPVT